jgi:hypothetical protein
MREARRPKGGVVAEERDTWCHVLEYARRVWVQFRYEREGNATLGELTLPRFCDMSTVVTGALRGMGWKPVNGSDSTQYIRCSGTTDDGTKVLWFRNV